MAKNRKLLSLYDLKQTVASPKETQQMVIPRYTTAQRDAIPAAQRFPGLTIYNTTTNKLNFHNGTAWEVVTSA